MDFLGSHLKTTAFCNSFIRMCSERGDSGAQEAEEGGSQVPTLAGLYSELVLRQGFTM